MNPVGVPPFGKASPEYQQLLLELWQSDKLGVMGLIRDAVDLPGSLMLPQLLRIAGGTSGMHWSAARTLRNVGEVQATTLLVPKNEWHIFASVSTGVQGQPLGFGWGVLRLPF